MPNHCYCGRSAVQPYCDGSHMRPASPAPAPAPSPESEAAPPSGSAPGPSSDLMPEARPPRRSGLLRRLLGGRRGV